MICDSNAQTNVPHKLLLTDTQVFKIFQAFASNSSDSIKLSKTQLSKMGQDRLVGSLAGSMFKTKI